MSEGIERHPQFIAEEQIGAERKVGDGRPLADHKCLLCQMRIQNAQRGDTSSTQKVDDRRIGLRRKPDEKPVCRQVTRQLVIVEEDLAPDFAPLIIAFGRELARLACEIVEDYPGL